MFLADQIDVLAQPFQQGVVGIGQPREVDAGKAMVLPELGVGDMKDGHVLARHGEMKRKGAREIKSVLAGMVGWGVVKQEGGPTTCPAPLSGAPRSFCRKVAANDAGAGVRAGEGREF